MPDQPPILVTSDVRPAGVVARVVINNPAKLNSLNAALMDSFVAEFAALAQNPDLRAVVLTGAGTKAFVGGADITEMAAIDAPDGARAFITRVHRCCDAVRKLPVPVIAAMRGYTFGAGVELAAACDLRIATDDAIFGMPEVKLGIPSVVEAALLPALVGWGRAREILLLGENFSAADALAWRFVERVAPAGELDAAVNRWIDSILANGPRAMRLQKSLISRWENLPISEAIAAGIDAFADAYTTDEPARTMQRFLAEKRKGKS